MPCTEAYKEHIMYTFNGFARPSYTMRLSTHGVTGADGGKKKKVEISSRECMKCPQKVRQKFNAKIVQATERACCL